MFTRMWNSELRFMDSIAPLIFTILSILGLWFVVSCIVTAFIPPKRK